MEKELLKHCRLLCNYSQTELASVIGVHQTLIGKIESGEVIAQPDTKRKMKHAFAEKGITEKEIALLASVFESRKLKRNKGGDLKWKQQKRNFAT